MHGPSQIVPEGRGLMYSWVSGFGPGGQMLIGFWDLDDPMSPVTMTLRVATYQNGIGFGDLDVVLSDAPFNHNSTVTVEQSPHSHRGLLTFSGAGPGYSVSRLNDGVVGVPETLLETEDAELPAVVEFFSGQDSAFIRLRTFEMSTMSDELWASVDDGTTITPMERLGTLGGMGETFRDIFVTTAHSALGDGGVMLFSGDDVGGEVISLVLFDSEGLAERGRRGPSPCASLGRLRSERLPENRLRAAEPRDGWSRARALARPRRDGLTGWLRRGGSRRHLPSLFRGWPGRQGLGLRRRLCRCRRPRREQ